MADEIDDAIADAALAPKSTTVDGTQTVERDADDLLKLQDRVKAQEITGSPWGSLRMARVVPPGGC